MADVAQIADGNKWEHKLKKRHMHTIIAHVLFTLAGFLFVCVCIAEHDLAENGNIQWNMEYTVRLIAVSAVTGGVAGTLLCMLIYRIHSRFTENKKNSNENVPLTPIQVFFISFLLNLAAWLPAYLAYYPGICAYDTPIQLGQVFEGYMIDHHPIAHTLLFKAAMYAGQNWFHSINTGMGIYTLCQMAFLAFGFAYGIYMLARFRVKKLLIVIVQLLVMFYPFNIYMSVSTTKDTVFTGFFLIMMSSFAGILLERRNELRIRPSDVVFFISGVGAVLFRNNCIYAIIVLVIFLFVTAVVCFIRKNNEKLMFKLLLNVILIIAAGQLSLSALFSVTNAEQGDRREMLSMPIQQFARCMMYHGGVGELAEDDGTMDESSRNLINDFLLNEAYRNYVPAFADPVKSNTNTYVARYRSGDFINTYLKLLKKYPGDFINAALALDAGYLYPGDESHAHINDEEGHRGRGYIQTYWVESELSERGLTKASKWESLHEIMENWADKNAYLDIPVLKYIFVPGTFLWLYILLAGIVFILRKYRMFLPLTLIMGYFATLFLGPTVQLRYIFPIMSVLPFMAILLLQETED
jgi:hypothetical protein